MVSSKGMKGLVLLVISIVVVAALCTTMVVKNEDGNPNGILGTYTITDYYQYGTDDGINWKWYTTESKAYDGEKIRIDSYDNGTIKATCILKNEKYDIIGYYDPATKDFGYTSFYNYTPTGSEKVIDWLQGSIIGDTMNLWGYTVSSTGETPVMYTFNFTFVKEGKSAQPKEFKQVMDTSKVFNSTHTYQKVGVGSDTAYTDPSYSLSVNEYKKGVYNIKETVKPTSGTSSVTYNMTATTMYQDEDRTALRAISYHPGQVNPICVSWIMIEGDNIYQIWDDSKSHLAHTSCVTLYSVDGSEKAYPTSYNLSGRTMTANIILESTLNSTQTYKSSVSFGIQGQKTNVVPISTEHILHINVIPNGGNGIVFFYDYTIGDIHYYGDMMGSISSNGNISVYGFIYGTNGEAIFAHGTVE